MLIFLSIIIAIVVIVYLFMQQPKFGKAAAGERLQRIRNSPNYKDGRFQNIHHTPNLTEGVSYTSVLKEFFFTKHERKIPAGIIPSVKTDLLKLPATDDLMVWFGHSSYFIQIDGKKILVDPVLSGVISPLAFTTKPFSGSDIYKEDDMPPVDYLFITHDHWDHLDYTSIKKLKPKISKVICPLGVGAHLEYWGYDSNIIIERDWNEEIILDDGFKAITTSARHFSGRNFTRNKALWTAYILQTPTMKIFLGGDSGYDTHFKEIGDKHGPFDLAILENGQYDKSWRYIHMMPEEVVQAAKELRAKKLLAVHSSKFSISNHAWDDPLIRVAAAAKNSGVMLITPMIGEPVYLKNESQQFSEWWKSVE